MGIFTSKTRYSGNENIQYPFRIGTVVDCNITSYSVDVKLSNFETELGVPIIGVQGATISLDTQWVTKYRGAQVVLIEVSSQYYVLGTLPLSHIDIDTEIAQPTAIDGYDSGGADENYSKEVFRAHQNHRPHDFFDGDKIVQTESGIGISLLNEGIAILKSSPMSQFILGRFKDFFKLIARVGNFYSDFGEVNVTHTTEGRVGINTKGGASFTDETHPKKAKWTVRTWVGDYPNNEDSRLFIRVNDADDSEFVTMMFDIKGTLTLETSKDNLRKIGRNEETEIEGYQHVTVKKEIIIKSDVLVKVNAPMIKLNCS